MNANKRDLSLLTEADGTLMRVVTPKVAARFHGVSTSNIYRLMKMGVLASEGPVRQRRILVDSLREHEPFTPQQRSAHLRALNAALTSEQRSAAAKIREAKKSPEERRATARKINAALTPAQRSERSRKGAAARSEEERSASAKARQAKIPPERRSSIAKARQAKIPPKRRSEIAKVREAKKNPQDRGGAIGKRAAKRWADLKAAEEELRRLKAIESGVTVTTSENEDTSKHDLRLLMKTDGTLMDRVRPEVADRFLMITPRHRRRLCKGPLVKVGSNQRSFITVASLLEYAGLSAENLT